MATRRRKSRKKKSRKQRKRSRSSLYLGFVIALLVGINLYVFLWRGGTSIPAVMERAAVATGNPLSSTETDETSPALTAAPKSTVVRSFDGEVVAGDSMGALLRRSGASAAEADRLIRALASELDLRSIRPGQTFTADFDQSGLLRFRYRENRISSVRAVRDTSGKSFEVARDDMVPVLKRELILGKIQGSVYQTITRLGHDTSIVPLFVGVFAFDLNFFLDQHPGDSFRILVDTEYLNGDFLRYKKIVAAEYAGQAGTYRAFLWTPPDRNEGYFSEDGEALERTFLKSPLKYARVSSRFSRARMHPVLHTSRGHYGVDYAAPTGTPVWAAAPGKVVYKGPKGGGGNVVQLDHRNGYRTSYLHLSKFAADLEVGQTVRRKDVIGYVGTTGLSTGPHLHFGVKKNGQHVDPLSMTMERGPGIQDEHKSSFFADIKALMVQMKIETDELAL